RWRRSRKFWDTGPAPLPASLRFIKSIRSSRRCAPRWNAGVSTSSSSYREQVRPKSSTSVGGAEDAAQAERRSFDLCPFAPAAGNLFRQAATRSNGKHGCRPEGTPLRETNIAKRRRGPRRAPRKAGGQGQGRSEQRCGSVARATSRVCDWQPRLLQSDPGTDQTGCSREEDGEI